MLWLHFLQVGEVADINMQHFGAVAHACVGDGHGDDAQLSLGLHLGFAKGEGGVTLSVAESEEQLMIWNEREPFRTLSRWLLII